MGINELIKKISKKKTNGVNSQKLAKSTNPTPLVQRTSNSATQVVKLEKAAGSTTANTSTGGTQAGNSEDIDNTEIVAQADSRGRPATPFRRLNFRSRLPASNNRTLPNNASVEEMPPHLTTPRCKPNDVILLYRDLSELTFTAISSLVSCFNMSDDTSSLKRRALHQESQSRLNGTGSCNLDTTDSIMRLQEKNERSGLVIWWRPFYTLWYFLLECQTLLFTYSKKLWHNKSKVLAFVALLSLLFVLYNVEGPHQQQVQKIEKEVLWWLYWVALGIMSSVGLGTGLHTFVLYLGPFIAKVTLAAYECKSLDFPEPPYPTTIECPNGGQTDGSAITLWSIMSKVRIEAMMWGMGTAIGELPPYFMARAAKLSGTEEDMDDEDIEEVLDIEERERSNPNYIKEIGIMERTKVYMHDLVHKMGFFGILACASIPNPLFDLAGITCGHFLVPFWTFFGATLIGKAVIKMHIQQLVVIFAFSEHHVEILINLLKNIPKIGDKIGQPFKEYLLSQRAKLHKNPSSDQTETPWLGWVFEKLIMIMVIYFVISIVNSFAQSYHKRLCSARRKQPGAKLK